MTRGAKIMSFILLSLLGLYFWGEYSGFKILKNESGHSWNASGSPYGAVHHK